MANIRIKDGKLIVGEGLEAVVIDGSNLNVSSLATKIEGHYPDNYPWYGYREDGFDEAIENNFSDPNFPPNNIPVSKIPACIRKLKSSMSAYESAISILSAKLAALENAAVRAEVK